VTTVAGRVRGLDAADDSAALTTSSRGGLQPARCIRDKLTRPVRWYHVPSGASCCRASGSYRCSREDCTSAPSADYGEFRPVTTSRIVASRRSVTNDCGSTRPCAAADINKASVNPLKISTGCVEGGWCVSKFLRAMAASYGLKRFAIEGAAHASS